MEKKQWQSRWDENKIGFHQAEGSPHLRKHHAQAFDGNRMIAVPLCGKTNDLFALYEHGHTVLGMEWVERAAQEFVREAENRDMPLSKMREWNGRAVPAHSELYASDDGRLLYWRGDVFDTWATGLWQNCSGIFDRAALVALGPDTRARYVDLLTSQAESGCSMLLVARSRVHPDGTNDEVGPPYSVTLSMVEEYYQDAWTIEVLEVVERMSAGEVAYEEQDLMVRDNIVRLIRN